MAADLFNLPYNPQFSSNGLPVAGAKMWFYASGTSTPQAIYTTSALNVEHTNPVSSDSAGRVPPVYLDDTLVYRLVITDADDVQLGDEYDPYYPGVSNATITVASGTTVSTRVALANIANPIDLQLANLTEAGESGAFVFSTDDLSTQVAADPGQKVYVAPASDTDGSSGAWVRTPFYPAQLSAQSTPFVPLGNIELPADFNNQLDAELFWDGNAVQYKVNPYDLIDFTRQQIVTFTFTGQPSDNETFVIGWIDENNTIQTKTYTYQSALTPLANEILIGASTAATITNTINCITRMGGTAGTDYALATVPHPAAAAAQGAGTTFTLSMKPAGRLLIVTEALTNCTVASSINIFFKNFATGLNGTGGHDGTTSALAWKTIDYSVTTATTPAVILVEDDQCGVVDSTTNIKSFSGKLKILGMGPRGRTLIAAMNENNDSTDFAFTASGANGAYVSTTASAGYFRAQFDARFRDELGFPRPMPTKGTDQTSVEALAGRGTAFWDAVTSYLYVHMHDGRIPDPADGWLYCSTPRFEVEQVLTDEAGVILLENLEFMSNVGTSNTTAPVRYRPVTTGSPNTARFGMRNCLSFGASGNGVQVYDAGVCVIDNCHTRWNHVDGFNYHSFVTINPDGEFITVYEHNCTARECGYDGWADSGSLSASSNCSTSHDSLHILRTGGRFANCNGSVIADVNGVVSVNLDVQASQPTGTASPKACFWHSGTGAGSNSGMYLWGCIAFDDGDSDVKLLDNTGNSEAVGQIHVKYWRGQPNGAVKGTLKDWDGVDL